MTDKPYARFVVRPDMGEGPAALIGVDQFGLFEPGMVYHVEESFLGDITIRKVGKSPLALKHPEDEAFFNYGVNNAQTSNQIMESGQHLFTLEEHAMRRAMFEEQRRARSE